MCCAIKVAGQRRSSSSSDDFPRHYASLGAPSGSGWGPEHAAEQQREAAAAAAAALGREAEMSEMVSALRHVVSAEQRGSGWDSGEASDVFGHVVIAPGSSSVMFSFSSPSTSSSSSPTLSAYSNTGQLSRSYPVLSTGQKRMREDHETSTWARLMEFRGSRVESSSSVAGNPYFFGFMDVSIFNQSAQSGALFLETKTGAAHWVASTLGLVSTLIKL